MISLQEIAKNIKLEKDDDGKGRINMDDPVMQKTGWSKDNPDLTVGGVLKQGEKHPEYKAAKAIVDKEKGRDSGEDDAGKLSGKSDFSRDGGDEPDPIGDKGDVPVGQLPDPSTRQGDTKAADDDFLNPKSKDVLSKMKPSDVKKKFKPGKPNKDTSYLSLEKDSTSWEYATEDSEGARYSGTLDDYPGLEGRVEDVVTRISSGQSSDEEIEKAEAMADNIEKAGDLNPEGGDDFEDLGIELRAGLDKHHSMKNSKKESTKVINGKKYKAIKESKKHPLKENYDRIFRSLK